MNVGIIGTGVYTGVRRQAIADVPDVTFTGVLDAAPDGAAGSGEGTAPLDAFLADVDVAVVTVPTAVHYRVAEAATKRGVHVFLEWPPATSFRECRTMVGLSEEAGVEVGVSRPLRFHPVFETLPDGGPAPLIVLRRDIAHDEEPAWPRWLADAVDVCCALAQSSSVQRVDAEAVRSTAVWPDAVAFGLRFHSGTYAQVSIRRGCAAASDVLYVAGTGFQIEAALNAPPPSGTGASGENVAGARAYDTALIEAETQAFLQALVDQRPPPVSILDALHTMRLVERLMQKLR